MRKDNKSALERVDRILKPQRRLQERMEKILAPQRKLQERMEKILAPQRKLQERMEKILAPQRKLQERMERILAPQRQLQERMERILVPQRQFQEQIEKYLKPLSGYLSSPLIEQVAISDVGVITISNEVLDQKVVEEGIASIDREYSSADEFLEVFFSFLEKLTESARVVFIYLFFPYLLAIVANVTTPIYEDWWKEYAGLDKRSIKKEIVRDANEIYSSQALAEFRFVYATILNVRESGSQNSEIVGELYLGKTVRLISKSKSWSYVEYEDSDSGDISRGWVFSRYLLRFER